MEENRKKKIALLLEDEVLISVLADLLGRDYDVSVVGAGAESSGCDLRIVQAGGKNTENKNGHDLELDMPLRVGALLDDVRHALLRREGEDMRREFETGAFVFHPAEKSLLAKKNGQSVQLTEKETGILLYLCRRSDVTVSRAELLENVWSYNAEINTRTLETHIYRLRRKIEKISSSVLIETTDAGYKILL